MGRLDNGFIILLITAARLSGLGCGMFRGCSLVPFLRDCMFDGVQPRRYHLSVSQVINALALALDAPLQRCVAGLRKTHVLSAGEASKT
jgi:hypothetical protein